MNKNSVVIKKLDLKEIDIDLLYSYVSQFNKNLLNEIVINDNCNVNMVGLIFFMRLLKILGNSDIKVFFRFSERFNLILKKYSINVNQYAAKE